MSLLHTLHNRKYTVICIYLKLDATVEISLVSCNSVN